MTFGTVKSFMRAFDADFVRIDGTAETARFFLPDPERRIEIIARGHAAPRRAGKPRTRRFVRVS